ncbi:MLP-like protein 31 [Silene latifolia]|uniref:MLP-like protein 31 n=1 Tax=Silene latifolia TaxID=37657 RepID=UPI003D77DBE5
MGVTGKLEVEVDIKASGDVFHELFGSRPHDVSNFTPDVIHGCDHHEGELGQVGSVIEWEYTVGGKKGVAKELVELVDEEKKIIRLKVIDGDILKDYKSMTVTIHVVPQGDFDAIKWEIDFERFDDFGPYPTDFMDAAIKVTRDIEAHHLNE